jgi:hypothetical protein
MPYPGDRPSSRRALVHSSVDRFQRLDVGVGNGRRPCGENSFWASTTMSVCTQSPPILVG